MLPILLIFIKNPIPGHVKTRLANTLGHDEALRIYRILLEKTKQASLGVRVKRQLWYSNQVEELDDWSSQQFTKFAQKGEDLGARMQYAFEQAFQSGANKVLIIGSDCPELSPEILEQACQALDTHDFVLGPTPDGGYYLLGMTAMEPALFQNIAWSTDQVMPQTLSTIQTLDKRHFLLPNLSDIDVENDWLDYLSRSQAI
jgi:rSAM/selenodomain-associated transferase 1